MRRALLLATVVAIVHTSSAGAWAQRHHRGGAGDPAADPTVTIAPSVSGGAGGIGTGGTGTGGAGGVANATGGVGSGGSATSGGNNLTVSGGRGGAALGLPDFGGAGQCTPVGVGPGGFGFGGGGGGLFTWESPNCRNYYIAMAMIHSGDPDIAHRGWLLMSKITPEAHDVFFPANPAPKPVQQAAAPVPKVHPDYCGTWSRGDPIKPECQ